MSVVKYEIHESHAPLWGNSDWRYAIVMGGRGNGRSGTASRYVVSQLLGKEYTRGAIMRATREDIRASCWGDINDRLREQEIDGQFRITENDMFIERGANSLRAHGFRASSGSLTARLKSLAGYNLVWIEEGEETGEDEFRTLDDTLRTVKGKIRIIITLNTPSKNHWLIKKWFNLEPHPEVYGFYIPTLKLEATDTIFIGGTWRENEPNLDENTIVRYQKYKETNPNYYWQMIEGLSPETVMGRIYSGWREIDEIPYEARLLGYGLDFGFDPDPAAIVGIYYYNGGYILDENLYQTKLINEQLSAYLKSYPQAPIVADNAEPKSIAELKHYGLDVIPCEKGKESVRFGIKHVQGLKISYTKRSANLKNEYENYAWKVSKEGEDLGIEDPNCENHCMSAARYALTLFAGKGAIYEDPEEEFRTKVEIQHRTSKIVERIGRRAGL
jgi:phage terminase large subunit